MEKNRYVNTKFWYDTYISNLDPLEKLLFLYFITNQYTNICGFYEIPLRQIALDTGIDKENLEKVLLPRLAKAKKIYYLDGWICVRNCLKHQNLNNSKIMAGIKQEIAQIPQEILEKLRVIDESYMSHLCLILDTIYNIYIYNNKDNKDNKDTKIHKEVQELFSLYKKLYLEKIDDEPPFFNWAICEKMTKKLLKQIKFEELKQLLEIYFEENDPFFKKVSWSLPAFLSASVIHKLKSLKKKYGYK